MAPVLLMSATTIRSDFFPDMIHDTNDFLCINFLIKIYTNNSRELTLKTERKFYKINDTLK